MDLEEFFRKKSLTPDFRMDEVILIRLNKFSLLFREPTNRTVYITVQGSYIASAMRTYVIGWKISKELFIKPIAKCCSFDFGDYKGSYEVL